MNIITIENICKNYKEKKALDNVCLQIKQGELLGLLGVNGAGKTTLIQILCGLTKKSSGTVTIDTYDLDKDIDKIKKIVDISPQETSIANNLTVKENLEFFNELYNNPPDFIQEIVETFHLNDVLNQRAKTLSGGYKRRLSIAVALISKPKILFLDEPTLGLDVYSRRELWKIIERLRENVTIILTSHYLEEIERLCDRVAILSNGKLLQVGTVAHIKQLTNAQTFEDAFINLVELANE
ncbi:MAG: ABC transporter ATP-binding protein [Clostridiales bacterium]|nr:ABC transporter ATP-binding protein [Clostridiales bacterium]MBE5746809.1 ABC transporter ATP-binding protein [Clostridiales bacterium]MBE5753702.1 ABC transporter ATP-binding protein [Clostridiales bacterium]